MKIIATILLSFTVIVSQAQKIDNYELEPRGIYKGINVKNDMSIVGSLMNSKGDKLTKLIISVEEKANDHIPPVLYLLSDALYRQDKFDEAAYWFYIAQLRARYDVNRSADSNANAADYNQTYGPQINQYAFKDFEKLKRIVDKVIEYVKNNPENYDARWINLNSIDAFSVSLGKKSKLEKLSVDSKDWPEIKAKTIKEYHDGLYEYLASIKKE